MSESNIKTEIRNNEYNYNNLSPETVDVFFNSTNYSVSHATAISNIEATRPAMTVDNALSGIGVLQGIINMLHTIANCRHSARYSGYSSFDTGDIYQYHMSGSKQFNVHWLTPFEDGFRNKSITSVSATSIDWYGAGSNEFGDQVRYWAFIKGNLYSSLNAEIKATEKITSDQRKDYDVAVRMLALDAAEEWINEYVDAIAQSEKALLNIASARLEKLSRADLKSLFNDDVNIPGPLLELADTSYSDNFASQYSVVGNFDFDDLITRSNVENLYDLYNQSFMRPSTSLNNAQKYFGMGTYVDNFNVTRHFLNIVRFCSESSISNAKVGYDLNIYLTLMDVFYGANEFNIAENRSAFMNSNIHWSSKTYEKIFNKQFYTKTSVTTIKGLLDSNIYPSVIAAVAVRSGNLSVSSSTPLGEYIHSTNIPQRSSSSLEVELQTSAEDKTSAIRVDMSTHRWSSDDVANWLHLRGMLVGGQTASDVFTNAHLYAIARKLSGNVVNLLTPAGSVYVDTDEERQKFLLLTRIDASLSLRISYPQIVDITNLSSFFSVGGSDLGGTHPMYSDMINHEALYILNVFDRDTRKTLYMMGEAGAKSEAKGEVLISDNDNDNENDGDDSS
jgi:hypothetical protein